LTVFFGLAYAIAWGGSLLVAGATRLQGNAISMAQFSLLMAFMLLAPGLASLLTTALFTGREGLREIGAHIRHWRVDGRWVAVAVLTTPLVLLAVLWTLAALVAPAYRPGFNLGFFALVAVAAFIEEFGWSSFAAPRLLHRYGVLRGGLLLGTLWGLWHLMAGFMGSTPGQEAFWLADFLLFWMLSLIAYRILMTWVYGKTQSVLVAQIMHACFSGTLALLLPALAPAQKLLVDVLLAACLWALVALLAVHMRRPQTHSASQPQALA
jgi:membrane protease YdiL (CAAX protease family)